MVKDQISNIFFLENKILMYKELNSDSSKYVLKTMKIA